jgi:outer membrane receptor protein involved in Fe transport
MLLVAQTATSPAIEQSVAELVGTVRDSQGLPMPGVVVTLSGPDGSMTVATAEDGAYRFRVVRPGRYDQRVRKDGFRDVARRHAIEAGTTIGADIEMRPTHAEATTVTASRREESLRTAPGAVTTISSAEIRASAADNIPDLLRTAPGVNSVQFGARDINVNTRSSTGVLSNSMLAMVDGRSIFQPLYGAVYWDLATVTNQEIEQIEILNSPASSIWGANALSGVINVRTKSPRQLSGLRGYAGFGERGTKTLGAIWAESTRSLAYKISGGYFEQDAWDRDNVLPDGRPMPPTVVFENRGARQPKIDARIDWDGDPKRVWSIRGGVAGANGYLHSALGPAEFEAGSYASYLDVSYESDGLGAQVYWNRLDAPFKIVLFGLDEDSVNDTYVAEVTKRHRAGANHALTFGGSVRVDRFDITIAPEGRRRTDTAAFLEDRIRLGARADIVAGGRLDWFDTTGAVFAPRLGAVVKPTARDTVRVTYNRAFRAPSLLENFVNVHLPVVIPTDPPFFYFQQSLGSTDLRMERQDAFELGYSRVIGTRAVVFATLYTQTVTDDVWFLPVSFYGPGMPPPGWPFDPGAVPPLPNVFSFVNLGRVRDRGVEIAAHAEWARVSLQASYAFQDDPRLTSGTNLPLQINRPARHQAGAGLSYADDRWSAAGDLRFTDRAFWADVLTEPFWGYTDAYLAANGRLGYRLRGQALELWLSGSNLFDSKIKSHVFGDTVGRKVTAGVRWEWSRPGVPRASAVEVAGPGGRK